MDANIVDLSPSEARYKARADHYLQETLKILKELQAERRRADRNRSDPSDFVAEIKEILQGSR